MRQNKSLICKGKECVLGHIKKNKKIYLWGARIAGGLLLIKIILIIGAFFGTYIMASENKAGGQEEDALFLFYQIEDIAHQRQVIIHDLGTGYKMPQEEEFRKLENQFHLTQDLYKKNIIATEIKKIIDLQNIYLKKIGYHDPNGNEQFDQIEKKLNQLQ